MSADGSDSALSSMDCRSNEDVAYGLAGVRAVLVDYGEVSRLRHGVKEELDELIYKIGLEENQSLAYHSRHP